MRVALFGGSFDPPHMGHELAALYVMQTEPVDSLWFMPCFHHAFDKPLAPFEHRRAMCDLVASALGARARVTDVEERIGGPSRTLATVRRLFAEHPDCAFSLVIGSDLVEESKSWYGADELRRKVAFIVVGRQGAPGTMPVKMPAVSSTAVREQIAGGGDPAGLVSRAVLSYIKGRGLYRERSVT